MQRLKRDVVLLEEGLVMPDAGEQFALGKPAAALAREQGGGNTAGVAADAVGARELAVALDLALLAQLARKHPLRFCPAALGVWSGRLVHVVPGGCCR
jgi:hypothetical protein